MKRLAGFFGLVALVGLGCAQEKEDGPYVEYHENGEKREEGSYKDGELNGVFIQYYEDGTKEYEGFYEDGKLDGKLAYFESFVEFYESPGGQKLRTEGTYKDGKRDGDYVVYYDESNKKKVEGSYRNTRKHGLWSWYDKDGRKTKQNLWESGDLMESTDCVEDPDACN